MNKGNGKGETGKGKGMKMGLTVAKEKKGAKKLERNKRDKEKINKEMGGSTESRNMVGRKEERREWKAEKN